MSKNSFMVSVFRFLLLVFLFSCSVGDESLNRASDEFFQIQGTGYRFIADLVKYQQLDFNRRDPSLCQIDFEVLGISRNQNELTIRIERPKGCNGNYELVWDGKWQESSPRRMQVYLTGYFNSCTPTSEREVDEIKVDLAKVLREVPTDSFTFYLREHCSLRDFNCVGNCNLNI